MKSFVVAFACAAAAVAVDAARQAPADRGQLSIDQLIDIRHPSAPLWSPDGRFVAFVWDRAGVSRVYIATAGGGSADASRGLAPRELPQAGSSLAGAFWTTDGRALMVSKDGDLWRVPVDGSAATAVWTTPEAESNIAAAPGGARVAFVRAASLVVRDLNDGKETTVASDLKNAANLGWSPDGQHLVYTAGAQAIRHEQTPPYSGSKIIYTINENVPGQTFVVAASGGAPRQMGAGGFGPRRWVDAAHFVFDRTSSDYKRRTIFLADVAGANEPRAIHEDVEDKFWSIPGDANAAPQPSPDGKWIAFISDRDGWDHLYVMPARGGEPIQITKGKFEAWRPQW